MESANADVTAHDQTWLRQMYAGLGNSASSTEVAACKINEGELREALGHGYVEQAVFLRMVNEDLPLLCRDYDTKHLKNRERIAKTHDVLNRLYDGGPYREPAQDVVLQIITRFEASAAQTGMPVLDAYVLYGEAERA